MQLPPPARHGSERYPESRTNTADYCWGQASRAGAPAAANELPHHAPGHGGLPLVNLLFIHILGDGCKAGDGLRPAVELLVEDGLACERHAAGSALISHPVPVLDPLGTALQRRRAPGWPLAPVASGASELRPGACCLHP